MQKHCLDSRGVQQKREELYVLNEELLININIVLNLLKVVDYGR
jgi:hypothetical protein